MPSRVFLVTGATGAIGEAICRRLAASADHQVVMVARDPQRARDALARVRRATDNPHLRTEICDLSREAEIAALAARWQGPLHVLVNNAATAPRQRRETPEGIELQLATNVLGYFWTTRHLLPFLEPPARVVMVASYWAGDLDLDDLEFVHRDYDNDTAYRQAKQADRMLAVAFARRLGDRGVTVNACHPGDVNSRLSNDLGFGGHESPDQGADTPAWLSTADVTETGGYFADRRRQPCRFGQLTADVETLFRLCESYCT